MTARDLIAKCWAMGIELSAERDKVICDHPNVELTDTLHEEIRAFKPALLVLLDPTRAAVREAVASVYRRLERDGVPFVTLTEAITITGQAVDDQAIGLINGSGTWPAFGAAIRAWEKAWREAGAQ